MTEVYEDISVSFDNSEPTALFKKHATAAESILPFEDDKALFLEAIALTATIFPQIEDGANKKAIWNDVFTAALNNTGHEALADDAAVKLVSIWALPLAKTPPTIFKEAFNMGESSAEFCMTPLRDTIRHDIWQWVAAHALLGKAFELDGWKEVQDDEDEEVEEIEEVPATVENLVSAPAPTQNVMKVTLEGETFFVTNSAKQAMVDALDAMSNQPTIYFKCLYAITAVSEILGVKMLDYAIPNADTLEEFNWDDVIPGRDDTYPKAPQPPKEEFSKVKVVHRAVKAEKDERAKLFGRHKSGVQSIQTYHQRWKQWRDLAHIYARTNPTLSKQSVLDKMQASLKLCSGIDSLYEQVKVDVKFFKGQLVRQKRKMQNAEKLRESMEAAALEEEAAKASAKEAEEKTKMLQAEAAKIVVDETLLSGTRAQKKQQQETLLEKKNELARQSAEEDEKRKRLLQAYKEKATEKKQLEQQQKRLADSLKEVPLLPKPAKRSKKNDTSRLGDVITPRKKAELDGNQWMPPRKVVSEKKTIVYDAPGKEWESHNIRKLALLGVLRDRLKADGVIPPPMKFKVLMEYIGADSAVEDAPFNDKVFIYLVALILNKDRCVFSSLLNRWLLLVRLTNHTHPLVLLAVAGKLL